MWFSNYSLIYIEMKLNTCIACLIILIITVCITSKLEGVGMSPGTLTQLQSTSVPSNMSDVRPYFIL